MKKCTATAATTLCLVFTIAMVSVAGTVLGISLAGLKTQEVWIHPSDPFDWTVENASLSLNGRLYLPPFFAQSNKYPSVLLFHGVTRTLQDLDEIGKKLAMKGCVCLGISFHGHGLSEGSFPMSDGARYNESFGDAAGAYRWLRNQTFVDPDRIGATGQSMGAGTAIYLALQDLAPKFVAWYPATAYLWGDTPLYQYTSSSSVFKGFIIQGTNDTCSRCLPNYTQYFVDNNPGKIDLFWVEGGIHGATALDWPLYVEKTMTWWAATWQLSDVLPVPWLWIYAPWIAAGILLLVGIVDSSFFLVRWQKTKKARGNASPTGASRGEPGASG
nr:alpha/beta hydrolase [Candidatus Sigynarchaeota archaeon]